MKWNSPNDLSHKVHGSYVYVHSYLCWFVSNIGWSSSLVNTLLVGNNNYLQRKQRYSMSNHLSRCCMPPATNTNYQVHSNLYYSPSDSQNKASMTIDSHRRFCSSFVDKRTANSWTMVAMLNEATRMSWSSLSSCSQNRKPQVIGWFDLAILGSNVWYNDSSPTFGDCYHTDYQ